MVTVYLYTFIGILVVSVISLLGVFVLPSREDILRKYIFLFISLAVGALLGDAFIHLIPEALDKSSNATATSVLIILGILLFFILEKFLHWHHHGEDAKEGHIHPIGKLVLFSDGVHNFLDGIIIAASFMVNIPVGIATTVAVILHEIPQEWGILPYFCIPVIRESGLWCSIFCPLLQRLSELRPSLRSVNSQNTW